MTGSRNAVPFLLVHRPTISCRPLGREGRSLAVIDHLAPNPDRLRAAAVTTSFEPASHHYPGLRAPLPSNYLDDVLPVIGEALRELFGRAVQAAVIDASFSIVTTPPSDLSIRQRLPHCDAFGAERVALVHYLSPNGGDGTAFFRHRSTGFETVDETRAPIFFGQLDAELRHGGVPPPAYVADSTALFERIALADAHYNRALLYPSFLLHSGAIAPGAALSPDPAVGRLTVTAFLSVT